MAVIPVVLLLGLGWVAEAGGWLPSALAQVQGTAGSEPVYFQCNVPGARAVVEKIQLKVAGDMNSQIVSTGKGYRLDVGPLLLPKEIDTVRARLWSIGACSINPIHTIGS
jgi:hypothetical protein